MPVEIAPTRLTADLTHIGEHIDEAVQADAERIHDDVMDGRFVPNLTFGPLVLAAIKPLVEKAGALVEAHLLIEEPARTLPDFATAAADVITAHV